VPPIPFFAEAADELLFSVSLAVIRDSRKEPVELCSLFFLRRIAIMMNSLYLSEIIYIDDKCEQEMSLMRDIIIQFHEATDLITKSATEADLSPEPAETIRNLAQGVCNGLDAARDRVEAAYCNLALALSNQNDEIVHVFDDDDLNPSQPSIQSQSSAFSASDVDRVDAHVIECQALHAKANKALEMANVKCDLVSAENQMIYALQIDKLALNLEASTAEIQRRVAIIAADRRATKAAKDRLPFMMGALQGIETVKADLEIVAARIRNLKIKAAPVPPASIRKGNSAKSNSKSKGNARAQAQIKAIDSVISAASDAATLAAKNLRCSRAAPVDSRTHLMQFPADHESAPSDEEIIDEEERMIALRKEARSTTSHIVGEAINADTTGAQGDSLDSAVNDHPPTTEDLAFLSNSQQKSASKHHPRFKAAKQAIEAAAVDDVVSLSKIKEDWIKDIKAFCRRGHRLDLEPKLRLESTTASCSFCKKMLRSKFLVTCPCSRSSDGETFYACHDCLKEGFTHPPPPECPSLQCPGSCTLRYIGVVKACAACSRSIPPNTRAWFCSAERCKQIICTECRNASLDALNTTAPPPPSPAYSSMTKSSSGLPVPIPGLGPARRQ